MSQVPFNPDKHYLDAANPCSKGHTPTRRYIKSGECVDCSKAFRDKRTPEKVAQYLEAAKGNSHKNFPSKKTVLLKTLEAQIKFLQDNIAPTEQVQAQIDLINKALAHKYGDRWEVRP